MSLLDPLIPTFDLLAPRKRGRPASQAQSTSAARGAMASASSQALSTSTPQRRAAGTAHSAQPIAIAHYVRIFTCDCCGEELHIRDGLMLRTRGGSKLSAWEKWTALTSCTPEEQARLLATLPEEIYFDRVSTSECSACLYTRLALNKSDVVVNPARTSSDPTLRQRSLFTTDESPAVSGNETRKAPTFDNTLPYPRWDSSECH